MLPGTAIAQSGWFARSWQSDPDGLPDNSISGVVQTLDGFLWLGTASGLVRFDGIRFEPLTSTNFVTDQNRGILAMIRSRDGGLRLAMDRGAVVFLNAGAAQAFLPGRDLPNRILFSLVEDREGALWVIYRGGGVCRIKDGKVKVFTARDGLPSGAAICSIGCDKHGRVWFNKGGQFGEVRENHFHVLRQLDEPQLARLAPARGDGLWMCAGTRLFRLHDNEELENRGAFNPSRAGTVPTALLEDREGAVWIGTSYSGLFRYASNRFESIATSHQEITSLDEDREGNLWVGTAGGGLNRVQPRAVKLEGAESGLPYEAVQSICEDIKGELWAATQNGLLARRVQGRWAAVPESADWPGDATCVAPDASGAVWIGTRLHGLFCWRDGRFVRWGNTNELAGETLHTLLVSKAGDLWIGEETPDPAVQCLRAGRLRTLNVPQDIRVIRACTEDAAGNIWFGTSKGVLLRISGDRVADETSRTSGEPTSIRCLHATPDGSVWIGYAGWGVGWIKEGHYHRVTTEQGLGDDWVSEILDDGRGWLWLGANRGIFKVRQSEFEDLTAGRIARLRSVHYGRGEGLPSLQATFGDAPGAWRSRDGRLWLPMRTALAVVDPEQLRENLRPPSTLLTRVAVDERTVAWYGGSVPVPKQPKSEIADLAAPRPTLRLPPGHHRLQFDFPALSFTAPANVNFRYRLEGFDENWAEADKERRAPYSRLPAGKYRFRVVACSGDGVWDETGAALSFEVLPFFWQTWAFRIAALALFTLCVISIVRYVSFRRLRHQMSELRRKFEQQEALHKERARIAKDIHDDVGANLTQIALLGELARQDEQASRSSCRASPDKASERIEKISGAARQAVKSLDEIVWAVNPRNDTLAHLIDYTGQFALDYLRLAGIRCRLDFPEPTVQREISTDARHNLFLVVKEALHNIVKHAHATEVWLKLNASDGALRVVIEDNGCGFERAPHDAVADGLRNMRQRMTEIGGECRIESRPGAGTQVSVEFPWPAKGGAGEKVGK
jgi:signal transduction histidine kinase/ligand-binding sensor domain-containing protein